MSFSHSDELKERLKKSEFLSVFPNISVYKIFDSKRQKYIKKVMMQEPIFMPKHLTFEGGGAKGFFYGGAGIFLEGMKILENIENVNGTSAGSIAALLVALGYSAKEANEILSHLNLEDFLEKGKPWPKLPAFVDKFRQLVTILKTNSLSSGKKFEEWLQELVARKFFNIFKEKFPDLTDDEIKNKAKNTTFNDLEEIIEEEKKLGKHGFKHLFVVATNISRNSPETTILSAEKFGKMPLWQAVLASSAFPLVFPPVTWERNEYIDGAAKQNVPIIPTQEKNRTLVLKIDSKEEINEVWGIKSVNEEFKKDSREILKALATAATDTLRPNDLDKCLVVRLDDNGVKTLDFNINRDLVPEFINSAELDTADAFENFITGVSDYYVFDDLKHWVSCLTHEQLKTFIEVYKQIIEQLKNGNSELYTQILEQLKDEENKEFELINYVEKYITFLENWEKNFYQFQKEIPVDLEFPSQIIIMPLSFYKDFTYKNVNLDTIQNKIEKAFVMLKKESDNLTQIEEIERLKREGIAAVERLLKEEKGVVKNKKSCLSSQSLFDKNNLNQGFIDELTKLESHIEAKEEFIKKEMGKLEDLEEYIRLYKHRHENYKKKLRMYSQNFTFLKDMTWTLPIERKMKIELEQIESQIGCIQQKISNFVKIHQSIKVFYRLHDANYEDTKALVGFQETEKILLYRKRDLENKLGIKKVDTKNEDEIIFSKKGSDHYHSFSNFVKSVDKKYNFLLQDLDLNYPILEFVSKDNAPFLFDLRNFEDLQLYLLACALYMDYKDKKNRNTFVNFFKDLFDDHILGQFVKFFQGLFNSNMPTKITDLETIINKNGKINSSKTAIAAYRLEALLRYFEENDVEEKKIKTPINLDRMFGLPTLITKQPSQNSQELRNVFNSK